jgi:hypothetical protein
MTYEQFEGTKHHRSLDRKYTIDQLMRRAIRLPGDVAECGTYRGATAFLLCKRLAGTGKEIHLFDSFEGLSKPRTEDGLYWAAGNLTAAEEVVRENLKEFPFVSIYKGWIPERFNEVHNRHFCLVHIDVDLYQPTLDSVRFFYERLVPGGLMVLDDYGFVTCPGARQAVDSFFAGREPVLELTTGQALVIKEEL